MKQIFSTFREKANITPDARPSKEELIKKLDSERKQQIISSVICAAVLVFCYIFFTDTENGVIRYPKIFIEIIEKGYIVAGYFVFAALLLVRDIILAVFTNKALKKLENDDTSDIDKEAKANGKLKKILSFVLALIMPLFGAIELLTFDGIHEPVNAPGVYITLDAMGVSGERIPNPYNGEKGSVWINRSLFADCLFASEFVRTADGDMKIFYQDIYILREASYSDVFAKALVESSAYSGDGSSFRTVEIDGLDSAYILGAVEAVAVKDNLICLITSDFDSEDEINKALVTLSQKWNS